ncbi:MAG: toll/interleukin-1 receptor domain-containing protein, partial [Candidatus Cryptobacteroides sp.]
MYKPIFISYSRKDKDYVIPFAKELDNRVGQNRIWIDWTGIESGEDFKDRIMNAIDRSQVILFMLSDNSLQSEYAKMEVEYAHNTNKKVIPVILDGKPLRGWFLFSFGRINYTDISDNAQVDQLVETLKKFQYAVNPKYLELARTYLNEHPKDVLYQVDYVRDDDDLNCSLLLNFTEKEIDCIRFFHEELGYSFMDLNYIDKWEGDENLGEERRNILFGALKKIDHEDGFLVDNIDYSQKVKAYKFRRAFFFHGFEGQPELSYFGAIINDEDYMKLLAIKMEDRKFCFNKLRYLMPDVFESISRDAEFIDEFLRNDFSVTYAVEMTEVEEDVFNIIGDESVSEEIY